MIHEPVRRPQSLSQRLHLDVPLILGIVAAAAVGFMVLYSAGGQEHGLVVRQAVRLGMALVLMVLVAQIGPRHIAYWAPWLYGGSVGLLVAVLVAGDTGGGAQRWLDLGLIRFQPSSIIMSMITIVLDEQSCMLLFQHSKCCYVGAQPP
jgi:rod shape determining protein RodA